MGIDSLTIFYKSHLEQQMLPFWDRALDHKHGGIYTCYNNTGSRLLSKDKYTWSQGRYLWLWSKIVDLISKNRLDGPPEKYKSHLRQTVRFLENNLFLENGNCAFLLSETGEKKESTLGEGYDISIFADCFVVLGLAGYASLFGDRKRFKRASALYDNITSRLESGNFRTDPYPVPEGYRSHAIPMIMLNTTYELALAAECIGDEKSATLYGFCVEYMEEIVETFCLPGQRVIEMLPDNSANHDTLLYRHTNPGHTIESMWFVIQTAQKTGKTDYIPKAIKIIKRAIKTGWDSEHGGLFRFTDRDGGKPKGRTISSSAAVMETLIQDTWDMKLWWPHSEALYATLLAYQLTGSNEMMQLHQNIHDYTFSTFPNPDLSTGEWIQIRNRQGKPVNRIAALPVKDPFHIIRNLILMLELPESNEHQ
jgi:N-acylglucosamine 2-epimerase